LKSFEKMGCTLFHSAQMKASTNGLKVTKNSIKWCKCKFALPIFKHRIDLILNDSSMHEIRLFCPLSTTSVLISSREGPWAG